LAQEKFLIRTSAVLNCQQGHGLFRGIFRQSLKERSGIFPHATAASFHTLSNSLFTYHPSQGSTNSPKIQGQPQNSKRQTGDTTQVFRQSLKERSGIFPHATAASFHTHSNSLFTYHPSQGSTNSPKIQGQEYFYK